MCENWKVKKPTIKTLVDLGIEKILVGEKKHDGITQPSETG